MLDVPGKPQGPLTYSNISGEAITLHWSPPKDDGGSPITNYVIEKKNKTGEWEKVGQALQLSFRVRNLQNGNKYEFRVRSENQYGLSDGLEADSAVQAKNPFGNH